MGQAGSLQQKSALRDVLSLRRGVSSTELEEVLRTFCALFPLELPVTVDASLASSVTGVDIKERRLFDVVHSLLQEQTEQAQRNAKNRDMTELVLTSFRRIIRWRNLYKLCAKCSMKPFISCLYRPSPRLVLSVLETLELMLSPCPGFEFGDKATERCEAANRRNFGDAGGYEVLRSLLTQYGALVVKEEQGDAAAVLAGVLKLFCLTLVTRRVATDVLTCSQAVDALMNARVSLLDLCHCPDREHDVMRLASELVKELFSIVTIEQVHELQETAREYGALLYALATAVQEEKELGLAQSDEKKVEDDDGTSEIDHDWREICVDLVELFCAGNMRSKKTMHRIFPVELFTSTESHSDRNVPHRAGSPSSLYHTKAIPGAHSARALPHFSLDFEPHRRTSIATSSASSTTGNGEIKRNRMVTLAYNAINLGGGVFERWLDDARAKGEHWQEILEAVRRTHETPELVWRATMRSELCQALHTEIEALERRRRNLVDNETAEAEGSLSRWDYEMFYVEYPSVQAELFVSGYFVEYLIPRVADLTESYEIAEPVVLAWHLSDQLAVENDEKWAILCVRCLRLIIRRYAILFHGQLPTLLVLRSLQDHANHPPAFLRECFLLLNTAIVTTRNTPSASVDKLCTSVTRTVVDVLADPVLLATLSSPFDSQNDEEDRGIFNFVDAEDAAISVVNDRDALIRAGISLLLAIIRRAKFVLRLIRPKRVFLCRLLAVETLDHVTITRLLFVLKQLALQDINREVSMSVGSNGSNYCPSILSSSISSHTSTSKDSNWRSLTLVYLLLASCDPKGMGMCVAAAEFLKECSELVSPAHQAGGVSRPSSFSELNELLNDALGCGGCGMGRLLTSVSADAFANIFNAAQKRAADVNWGLKQRVRLYRYLKHKYVGSNDSSANVSGWNTIVGDDIDGHHYEDDDLFIGNIFLRSYIEGEGDFLNVWTPEMYSDLINALFKELVLLNQRKSTYSGNGSVGPLPSPSSQQSSVLSSLSSAAEPWEVQVLILKALARLVPSHCAEVEIKSEFYESLLAPLRRSMLSEIDQVRGILSLELLVTVLSVPEKRSINTAACRLFLEQKGLSVLADSLVRMRSPAFQQVLSTVELLGPHRRGSHTQNMARMLLYRSTELLSILSKQQAGGIRAITKNHEVITALLELASRQMIMQYADIDAATACLSCLGGLCHYAELRTQVVAAGGLLMLLDTVTCCPAEELSDSAPVIQTDDEQDTKVEGNQNSSISVVKSSSDGTIEEEVQRKPSRFFGAIRSAALVLRACLGAKNATAPSVASQVLQQLLTPSFVRILRGSPDQFVLELQTTEDINTATLIWTTDMRRRLQNCIANELVKVKAAAAASTWPRWNPEHLVAADSFRYQYPELADVLVLHDVYLSNFVVAPVKDLDLGDIDMASFSEALLISIQSHDNVLRILHERGTSDPSKEAAVHLMRQAMEKLVSTHPQHNLAVRDLPLSDGSPAVSPATAGTYAMINAFSPTDDRDWDISRMERFSSSGIEDLTV